MKLNVKLLGLVLLVMAFSCLDNIVWAQCSSVKSEKTKFVYPKDWSEKLSRIAIPNVDQIERVKPGQKPSVKSLRKTEYIVQPQKHEVTGHSYVILTDHNDKAFLKSIEKLAEFRNAIVIKTNDLALLYTNAKEMSKLKKKLLKRDAKFVAIAPKIESYRENMLLGVFEVLTGLDEDIQLDVYPGIIMASTAEAFAELIDRTIKYKPQGRASFAPLASCMIPNKREQRSLQKNGILNNWFVENNFQPTMFNLYGAKAKGGPVLSGDNTFTMDLKPKQFVKQLSGDMTDALQHASLLVLHGHGLPGVSCGVDIDALPKQLNTDVILCGSCFSASVQNSDLIAMKKSPDGYPIVPRKAFAIEAIDNGATVVMGHMRLNQGFPRLFPVLETFMTGGTVGEAYQDLINASLESGNFNSKELAARVQPENPRRIKQNTLLYVLFGDPALHPFQKLIQ
ncbi:hypothetical protein EMN47_03310 [Prolixibacteraceae bacterium JC049]|nr:hypothetical protein [Prolixibacteraceae bacterium JC049]